MESGRIFFDPSCNRGNMLFLGNGDSVFRGVVRPMMGMEESSKRRPFFSTVEELYDDEYYDEQLPEKKRRLTADQVHLLEKSFEEENKLEPDRKTQLAKKLGLQPRQVAVWFQNRRARWKTKQLERDYDKLKSAYDSLQANYDCILKENNIFKAELISLTEKLKPKEPVVEPTGLYKPEPIRPDDPPSLELAVKVEDRLSDGSSGVVEDEGPQLVDSGDSYFPSNEEYPTFIAGFDGTNSEEDDGSDDNRGNYFTNVFSVAEQQEPIGWFMWSS